MQTLAVLPVTYHSELAILQFHLLFIRRHLILSLFLALLLSTSHWSILRHLFILILCLHNILSILLTFTVSLGHPAAFSAALPLPSAAADSSDAPAPISTPGCGGLLMSEFALAISVISAPSSVFAHSLILMLVLRTSNEVLHFRFKTSHILVN